MGSMTVICLCIFISRGRGPPCKSDTCFCIAEHQRASHHIRLTLSTFVLVFTSHEGRQRNVLRNYPWLSSVRGFGSTLVTPPTEHNLYLASLWNGVMAALTIKPPSSQCCCCSRRQIDWFQFKYSASARFVVECSLWCSMFSVPTVC